MNIIYVDFGSFWAALSGIGTVVCALLALWGNPNLFRKHFVKIQKSRILIFNNKLLCAEVVLKNRRNFNVVVNQIIFLFGDKKQILAFGRDDNEILSSCSTKKFIFYQVQTSGTIGYNAKVQSKKIDLKDAKYAVVYVETLFGTYSRKLKIDELVDSINAYENFYNKKVKI